MHSRYCLVCKMHQGPLSVILNLIYANTLNTPKHKHTHATHPHNTQHMCNTQKHTQASQQHVTVQSYAPSCLTISHAQLCGKQSCVCVAHEACASLHTMDTFLTGVYEGVCACACICVCALLACNQSPFLSASPYSNLFAIHTAPLTLHHTLASCTHTHANTQIQTTHRSTDLLALPTCDPDKAFAMQIAHDEAVLNGPKAYVQCALLHTNSNGERRIRCGF